MQTRHHRRRLRHRRDDVVRKGGRVRRGETHALDALHATDGPQQISKRAALTKAAAALDRSLNGGTPSVATSNVLKNVLESLDSLPRPAEGTDREMDALDAALAELTRDALTAS